MTARNLSQPSSRRQEGNSAGGLFKFVQPLQARSHAISRAIKSHAADFTITVALNTFTDEGLGSCYVNPLGVGDVVKVELRYGASSNLEDADCVMLLGTGSGIAPLQSFWQEMH